jgi:hypothetical protein
VVEAIQALGPERCILMSDAGQRHNPMPAEALRVFAQSVYESGVSEEGVERMLKRNPLDLLELPPAPARAVPVDRYGAAALDRDGDGRAVQVAGAGEAS